MHHTHAFKVVCTVLAVYWLVCILVGIFVEKVLLRGYGG